MKFFGAEKGRKGFVSKDTLNLETVRARIAALDAEIPELEAKLRETALAGALAGFESKEQAAGYATAEKLHERRRERQLIEAALEQAEANDRKRQRRKQAEEFTERRRALVQHVGAWSKMIADIA